MRQKIDKDERIFLTKSQLIKREGWSEACIKLFSLTHDKEATNSVFKSASPVKLYLLEKIRQIETLDQFIEFKAKNLI